MTGPATEFLSVVQRTLHDSLVSRKQVVQSPSSHQGQPGGVGPMALTLGSHSRQTVDFGPQLCFTHALASVAMI